MLADENPLNNRREITSRSGGALALVIIPGTSSAREKKSRNCTPGEERGEYCLELARPDILGRLRLLLLLFTFRVYLLYGFLFSAIHSFLLFLQPTPPLIPATFLFYFFPRIYRPFLFMYLF